MKKLIITLFLISTIMIKTEAQTTDLQLIENTIANYFDGLVKHNPESLKKAFIPSATMKWVEKDYTEVNALEALIEHVTNNTAVKTITSITAINIVGDAANAQLELEYETFSYIDFMHLLKINGEWKIVSKTFTTKKKEF